MEVSEKEQFDNMSTCDSPGPCLQNRQCPRQFFQHFPTIDQSGDVDDPSGSECSSEGNRSVTMVDGEIIKYNKLNYLEVEKNINHKYYDLTDYYSSAMDILACYVKGQKVIYMESKYHSEKMLNRLMFPAIFLSVTASVLAEAVEGQKYGSILMAAVNAFIAFLLSIISYYLYQ